MTGSFVNHSQIPLFFVSAWINLFNFIRPKYLHLRCIFASERFAFKQYLLAKVCFHHNLKWKMSVPRSTIAKALASMYGNNRRPEF